MKYQSCQECMPTNKVASLHSADARSWILETSEFFALRGTQRIPASITKVPSTCSNLPSSSIATVDFGRFLVCDSRWSAEWPMRGIERAFARCSSGVCCQLGDTLTICYFTVKVVHENFWKEAYRGNVLHQLSVLRQFLLKILEFVWMQKSEGCAIQISMSTVTELVVFKYQRPSSFAVDTLRKRDAPLPGYCE